MIGDNTGRHQPPVTVSISMRLNFEKLFSIYIALLPILSIYNVPFFNNSLGYYLRIAFAPFLIIKLLGKKWICKDTIFIFIFFLYWFFRTGGDYIHFFIFFSMCIVYILAIYNGIFDMKTFSDVILFFTVVSCVLVLYQSLVHGLFHDHIQMVIESLIKEDVRQGYMYYWRNGHSVTSTTYRPSAFFLEPAHMCQYCFVGLAVAMKKWADNKGGLLLPIFIIIGMVATTSSQGVVFAAGVVIWAVFIKGDKKLIKRIIVTIFFIGIAAGVVYLFYIRDLFGLNFILGRIFGEVEGYNSIAGRNFANAYYLGQLSGRTLFFGVQYINRPDVYMTGIATFRYTLGIVGCALFYAMLAWSIRSLRNVSACIAVAFGALFCIAQATSSQSFIFFAGIAYAETLKQSREMTRT